MFAPCAGLLLSGALAAVPLALQRPQSIPRNEGWITDRAELLAPAEERALEARMESYRAGSGHEIALLTLPELGGEPIERVALETARAWGIGGMEQESGALIVVAIAERAIRIEVGRGLEDNLTDAISGRIIRDVIAPEFKAGRYAEGLAAGVEAVHAAIGGDYGPIERTREGRANSPEAALVGIVAMVVFLSMLRASRRNGPRGGGGVWVDPWLMGGGRGGLSGGSWSGGGGGGGGGFGGFSGGGNFGGGGATGGW